MKSEEDLLSFLDLLDLDEEIIDKRLEGLMLKNNLSHDNLLNLLHLLQYKHLINTKEDTECENDKEISMINNILSNLTEDNVQTIGKILYVILILSPSTIVSNAEHLLQQMLANMYVPTKMYNGVDNDMNEMESHETFIKLKICKSVLEAVIFYGQKLLMPFLEIPLEHLVYCQHEKLNTFFVTSMIPQIFESISGYHILDRIWNLLKQSSDRRNDSLKVLCSLSNYFLPVANYESNVIYSSEFWDIILYGLSSDCTRNRKYSMYLFKRALDCLIISKKDVHISSESIFICRASKIQELNKIWNNFFVLMDSLEEKQSNIVLPSLVLINTVKDVGFCWLNCAFKIGLRHDNAQVRFKCIQYRLDYPIHDSNEAHTLSEVLNDTQLFGDPNERKLVWNKMKMTLEKSDSLINVLKAMPNIKWAPVPLFYLTKLLTELEIKQSPNNGKDNLINILHHLFKIPCTNIIIRKAVFMNLFSFIGKHCCLNMVDYINLCGNLSPEIVQNINLQGHTINSRTDLTEDKKKHLLELLALHSNIDFALLQYSLDHSSDLTDILDNNIDKIKNICERQYSKKSECISEAIYLTEFYRRIQNNKSIQGFDEISYKICRIILNYVKSLLSSEYNFDIEVVTLLNEGLDIIISNNQVENREMFSHIFKNTLLLLKDSHVDLNKRVMSILIVTSLLKSSIISKQYVTKSDLITILVNGLKFNNRESSGSIGRLKNLFYEKSSEILYLLLEKQNVSVNNDIIIFIDDIFQSGGYGCLNWVLKIMNKLSGCILQEHLEYDNFFYHFLPQFLSRAWIGIEELKSNSQYAVCMKEFISLLLHDSLLEKPLYNNVILSYCTKIIEYGAIKTLPLYYLVNEINLKSISNRSYLICIFSDILLFTIVPKKENRILENVIEELIRDTQYSSCKTKDFHFVSHIRYLSLQILSKITDTEILKSITDFILQKVDEMLKNKQRYHGNSHVHRTLQAALQNLLCITLKSRLVNVNKIGLWCIELLGKLPHQQFVRTCLEWYISLFIYIKDVKINIGCMKLLRSENVPITSQFLIIYYVIMHKIKSGSDCIEEYQFVMDTFLSHTMGSTYSTRLYAQYLAYRLKRSTFQDKSGKYDYILEVIEQTLNNASAEKDKTYQKLLKDYFVHKFDIVEDLTPWRIFHYLPRTDNFIENVDDEFFNDIMDKINSNLQNETNDSFYNEWISCHKSSLCEDNFEAGHPHIICPENSEVGTIQKKYIPWKNMSDINIYGIEEKRNKSDLIVVASLIDRLPNLGGMARTSEVFGVLTYVVDSLRHLQDKQFQGLSVSAERWIDVEEVRPGQPLKDYLMLKKTEGYSLVAAEQTSSSTSLQTFKFPKKTMLLLGHEKEGVPCDLLPLMDSCVEIPQQGVIRSLNVHVTAAIFIWEYARQNML